MSSKGDVSPLKTLIASSDQDGVSPGNNLSPIGLTPAKAHLTAKQGCFENSVERGLNLEQLIVDVFP